jgi:hypothetical protein
MLWILVYITTAGQPAITEPMRLESCITLAARPEFAGSFCFNKDIPALTARPK